MKIKIIFLIFVGCTVLDGLNDSAQASAAMTSEKIKFWKSFRHLFLEEDFKKLAGVAAFPIEVRGTEDSDPRFSLNQEHFKKCFALIYPRDVGIAKFEKSHRDYIFELKELPETEGSKDQLRVGDLIFEKKSGKFKLVRFYLDTSEDNVKTNCQ